jgi:hypothetical protein
MYASQSESASLIPRDRLLLLFQDLADLVLVQVPIEEG